MVYNPVLDTMKRKQELMDEKSKMAKPKRTIPKDAVALIISKVPVEPGADPFLDLQVMPAEDGDEADYLLQVANLASNLLENEMFGEDEEEGFELDPDFLGSIDLGED